MRRLASLALAGLAAALLGGCGGGKTGAPVASQRVGQVFYLCCNLRYDPKEPTVEDGQATGSAMIPFATRVEVQKVTRDSVRFEAAGHPPVTLVHDGKGLSFEQVMSRTFVTEDPRLRLKKVPARQVKLIEKGIVAPGMTRDQVAMALGFPPADRTPSLDAPTWRYGSGTVVHFGGMQVTSVQQGSRSGARR